MKLLLSSLALLWLVAVGCVSPAKRLDPSLVSQIQEGKTTRAEVEQLLGKPKSTASSADGKVLAFYEFLQARKHPGWAGAFNAEAGTIVFRTLTILYASEVVETFLCEQSNTPVKFEWNGLSAGHEISDRATRQIIKGITSKGELIQWFGQPTMQTLDFQGRRVLCWIYGEKNSRWRSDNHQRDFRVVIDSDDFVQDFYAVGTTGFAIEPFR